MATQPTKTAKTSNAGNGTAKPGFSEKFSDKLADTAKSVSAKAGETAKAASTKASAAAKTASDKVGKGAKSAADTVKKHPIKTAVAVGGVAAAAAGAVVGKKMYDKRKTAKATAPKVKPSAK
jgi:hypothetical protein